MKPFFKAFAALMALLFAWAAYVQLNDPDAAVWIGIYLVAALGCLGFALGKLPYWLALVLGIAYLAGTFLFWPESFEGVRFGERGMANMNIERGRESLGLAITALVFLLLSWRIRRDRS
ncbi:transmembrane 220 family protein [Robiginitalea sp. M366]|uniref:transmembrane 220 family protein n=1 Tax=Robiginitalea aestuariiviva TaxID=3036903 RepID=UPI00240DD90B|nr:transmembrane 220 family protein [Robiginitalea aestuariiviva]MDG1572617.1 transmembrane 220 family protein [Robiginitalea aestuariiviva]